MVGPSCSTRLPSLTSTSCTYIAAEMRRILAEPRLLDGLAGAMRGDAASQERVDIVVLPVFKALAESHPE